MKFLVALALVAVASADVSHIVGKTDEYDAPIVRSSYDIQPEGNFQYAYETGNGIASQADGVVKNPNSDYAVLEVKGFFKYVAPDGTSISLEYIANEYGYQATGSHLPVAPEIPAAILRSLEYIKAHPAPVDSNTPYRTGFEGLKKWTLVNTKTAST